jgi:DNA adenine methylase
MQRVVAHNGGRSVKARPFLKWAGGKASSVEQLRSRVPRHYNAYFEPFLGGGALFFALQPKKAILSDSNERLVRTYKALRDNPQVVAEQLSWLALRYLARGELFYYEQRQRDVDKLFDVDVASWMIFLNKTGFNGLYRVNKKGQMNCPHGDGKPYTPDEENLRACSLALQGVQIEHWDFRASAVAAEEGDLVYFDPPYAPVEDTSFTKYTKTGFTMKDQEDLRDTALSLKKRGVHVILSNSGSAEAKRLYLEVGYFIVEETQVRRAINSDPDGRCKVTELIIS